MQCKTCEKDITGRGKSGLCQPCSARRLMLAKWGSYGIRQGNAFKIMSPEIIDWLATEASKSKVDMATIISSIVADAWWDENNGLSEEEKAPASLCGNEQIPY